MPHLDNPALERIVYITIAVVLIYIGFRLGRLAATMANNREMAQKEKELFTAQKGFKQLFDSELETVRAENKDLTARVEQMKQKVEDYRKKAAGLGGLFNTSNKKADAMYALLLENEALEEVLYSQNEKLKQERTDALKEQLRATGYRRVLMTQLLSDDRIKGYVQEVLSDEKLLPGAGSMKSLPGHDPDKT